MVSLLLLALAVPADWVPVRWPWIDLKSLDLLAGTPINCLLLELEWKAEQPAPIVAFTEGAAKRNIVTLRVIRPGGDAADAARQAMRAKLHGVVLEGDFPAKTAERVQDALADYKAHMIELPSRQRMKFGGGAPITGTYQGVWPGIQVLEGGSTKAGPTGAPWIDTNSGFLRAARALTNSTVWLGNLPPPKTVTTGERYLAAICDAALVGSRWVVALDEDLASRLRRQDPVALRDWGRIAQHLRFFEDHRDWRSLKSHSKLAVVQDPDSGALLSGGILDMIAAKHTPVRVVPPQRLKTGGLEGTSMAVNVDNQLLTTEQREALKAYSRSGGTVLTAPPESKAPLKNDQITLANAELERLNDIWRDVQSMIGRTNLGARLFNVSSMLSNLLASPDGKQLVIHLVNYSNYPAESVTVHLLGNFKHARLYTPEGVERDLEIYKTEEGAGIEISQVFVCASVRLDR